MRTFLIAATLAACTTTEPTVTEQPLAEPDGDSFLALMEIYEAHLPSSSTA
jgi:hypothetical protein